MPEAQGKHRAQPARPAQVPTGDDPADEGLDLVQKLEETKGARCAHCGQTLCFHQLLASIALGIGHAPRCLGCAAQVLEESPTALAESLLAYIDARDCYRAAWNWASEKESVGSDAAPGCLLARH